MTDLTSLTLADAREGLAQKSFTALELTDAHLAAMEKARALNAYVLETPDRARVQARVADTKIARGDAGHEDFAGLRPHTPSDPPRHIAWKAVARNPEAWPLLVKQFADGAGEELWLDWEHLAGEADDETRLSVLAGWVLAAERGGLAYGLALPGRRLPPANGPAHCERCLEALALHGIDDHVPQAQR